jgi:hypothetical protein
MTLGGITDWGSFLKGGSCHLAEPYMFANTAKLSKARL